MLNRSGHKTSSLLLAALMLAWATAPPAVQHAHAGGEETAHRHADGQMADHPHHRGSHDEHHEHGASDELILVGYQLSGDCVAHLHWTLLGIDFSTPVPTESDDDRETDPPVTVWVMGQFVPTAQSGPLLDRVLPPLVCDPCFGAACRPMPTVTSKNAMTSIPLCDVARRARTGVLLA